MNAGTRLETVAGLVPPCKAAADIGTDHGYVPALLVQSGRCRKVIASDIAAGPCDAARETVCRYHLGDAVEVRQAPGLQGLAPYEVQTVVIAGMGGATIRGILEECPAVAETVSTFVLQPMNGQAELRIWLTRHGYVIRDEQLCKERDRLYTVLLAVPGVSRPLSELEALVGPVLLHEDRPYRLEYLEELHRHYGRLLNQMGQSREAPATEKYRVWKRLEEQLEEWIDASRSEGCRSNPE
jgi:tRNA (adenine22-N1)-methyltransferase